jgi:hypothetical protein
VIASNPNGEVCTDDDSCQPGIGTFYSSIEDPMLLGIAYYPAQGLLSMGETGPDGNSFDASYVVSGQSFTEARVGTDFGSTPWDGSYSYTPPAQYVKGAAYSRVFLTSYSGHTASLWSWWVHHKQLVNSEQQSGQDWVAAPTDLTNGGTSFQTQLVPQYAQGPNHPLPH